MTSSLDCNCKFSERTFSTPAISEATSKLFSSQDCSDDKNCLYFPAFSSRFVDFAVQFCFRCKFSFHEERRSSQVWQWCDFLGPIKILLLRIATTEIASFVETIDYVKWLFFVFIEVGGVRGKGRLSSHVERF